MVTKIVFVSIGFMLLTILYLFILLMELTSIVNDIFQEEDEIC